MGDEGKLVNDGLEEEALDDLVRRFHMRKERLKKLVRLDAPEQIVQQEERLIRRVTDVLLSRNGEEAERVKADLGLAVS